LKDKALQKVLVIGSGPTVVGRSSEYDYATVQACLALKEESIEVIVLNPNSASIHTEKEYADRIYIEPITIETLRKVIQIEKPDVVLASFAGLGVLDLINQAGISGVFSENNVELLAFDWEVIGKTASSKNLKNFLAQINEPYNESYQIESVEKALTLSGGMKFPLMLKAGLASERLPSKHCENLKELKLALDEYFASYRGYDLLLEKSIVGWKELEYELIRDYKGKTVCVSNLENVDPVGIHAGDSVVVSPAMTVSNDLDAKMKKSAENIISGLGIVGNCSVRFALKPDESEFVVLDVIPGFNRNSALISKVTRFPLARVSAKLALGFSLDDLRFEKTEPSSSENLKVCAVRIPKWSFDALGAFDRKTGSAMQATGEVVAVDLSFEAAFMKAVRSVSSKNLTPALSSLADLSDDEILNLIKQANDERIFAIYEALKRNIDKDEISSLSGVDIWFLERIEKPALVEKGIKDNFSFELYLEAKANGFSDEAVQMLNPLATFENTKPSFCEIKPKFNLAGSQKPYVFSTYSECSQNQSENLVNNGERKVLVIGAGPSGAGHSGELDFCNAQSMLSLKKLGFEVILVNNNPASVTTGSGFLDKLYIEPITVDDIKNIIEYEKPKFVLSRFTAENSVELTRAIEDLGITVLGPGAETQSLLGNPDKIKRRLLNLGLKQLSSGFHKAVAFELDVVSDGEDVLVPGISEHIEKYVINPGDSISVYPAVGLSVKAKAIALNYAQKIAREFHIRGIFNLQLALFEDEVYVIKLNAKAFYNIPMLTKATSLPIIDLAIKCMFGKSLNTMGYKTDIYPESGYSFVRVPVFSFDKISAVDNQLGATMKSTGEVLGIAETFEDALFKGLTASGMRLKSKGNVVITVRNSDKQDVLAVAERFAGLGFKIFATAGTASKLNSNWIAANYIRKLHEGSPNILDLIYEDKVVYLISTSEENPQYMGDDIIIRRKALENKVPTITTMETANALLDCLSTKRALVDMELVDITKL